MAFIERTLRRIAGAVKEKFTGDPLFYWEGPLSRESIMNIHPGDSIRLVNSDESFTITDTDAKNGVVRTGTGLKDFFEANQQVRIGCPGGKGH